MMKIQTASLYPSQHGFLPDSFVETAQICSCDFLSSNIDDGKHVDAIFLYHAKPFDKIPHSLLLSTLRAYGISGPLFSWISNYLSDRVQVVRINQAIFLPTDLVLSLIHI